jgi:hypothetical protein
VVSCALAVKQSIEVGFLPHEAVLTKSLQERIHLVTYGNRTVCNYNKRKKERKERRRRRSDGEEEEVAGP